MLKLEGRPAWSAGVYVDFREDVEELVKEAQDQLLVSWEIVNVETGEVIRKETLL